MNDLLGERSWKGKIRGNGLSLFYRLKSDFNFRKKTQQIFTQRLSFFFFSWRWNSELLQGMRSAKMRIIERLPRQIKGMLYFCLCCWIKHYQHYKDQSLANTDTNCYASPAVTHSFHWWKPWQKTRCVGLGFVFCFFVFVFYCSRSSLCSLLSTQHYREYVGSTALCKDVTHIATSPNLLNYIINLWQVEDKQEAVPFQSLSPLLELRVRNANFKLTTSTVASRQEGTGFKDMPLVGLG